MANRYTDKTEISYDDYLRLEGLLTIARDLNTQLYQVERSVQGLIGESDPNGHATDAVYSRDSARVLLEKSDITILPAPAEG